MKRTLSVLLMLGALVVPFAGPSWAEDFPVAIQVMSDVVIHGDDDSDVSSEVILGTSQFNKVFGYFTAYIMCLDNTAGDDSAVSLEYLAYDPNTATYFAPLTTAGAADNMIIANYQTAGGNETTSIAVSFSPRVTTRMKLKVTGLATNEDTTTCDVWLAVQ